MSLLIILSERMLKIAENTFHFYLLLSRTVNYSIYYDMETYIFLRLQSWNQQVFVRFGLKIICLIIKAVLTTPHRAIIYMWYSIAKRSRLPASEVVVLCN